MYHLMFIRVRLRAMQVTFAFAPKQSTAEAMLKHTGRAVIRLKGGWKPEGAPDVATTDVLLQTQTLE